jgi:hypothetical protein
MFNRGGMVLCCVVGLVMFLQSDAEYSSRCRATVIRPCAAVLLPQISQRVDTPSRSTNANTQNLVCANIERDRSRDIQSLEAK